MIVRADDVRVPWDCGKAIYRHDRSVSEFMMHVTHGTDEDDCNVEEMDRGGANDNVYNER